MKIISSILLAAVLVSTGFVILKQRKLHREQDALMQRQDVLIAERQNRPPRLPVGTCTETIANQPGSEVVVPCPTGDPSANRNLTILNEGPAAEETIYYGATEACGLTPTGQNVWEPLLGPVSEIPSCRMTWEFSFPVDCRHEDEYTISCGRGE